MTGLEIGLAVGLGVAVVAAFGALIWGYNWGSNDEHEYTQRYKAERDNLGKRLDAVKQSQEAGRQLRKDMARLRQEKEKARLQPTAPYPTLPPLDGCKVCGAGAYTYRWGQCLATWCSVNNKEITWATVEWQKYDHNYDVGWFPVCAHHASVLDRHGTVTRETQKPAPPRYPHRTGGTPPMPGSPPVPGTRCAAHPSSIATTHIWGYRATYTSLRIFQSAPYSGGGSGELLPVCEVAKRAFDREGYVVLSAEGYYREC